MHWMVWDDGALVSKITGIYNPAYPGGPVRLSIRRSPARRTSKEYTAIQAASLHYLLCDANACYDLLPPTHRGPGAERAKRRGGG